MYRKVVLSEFQPELASNFSKQFAVFTTLRKILKTAFFFLITTNQYKRVYAVIFFIVLATFCGYKR